MSKSGKMIVRSETYQKLEGDGPVIVIADESTGVNENFQIRTSNGNCDSPRAEVAVARIVRRDFAKCISTRACSWRRGWMGVERNVERRTRKEMG
jgi:hypothetical protein